jgi:hypothetical protein
MTIWTWIAAGLLSWTLVIVMILGGHYTALVLTALVWMLLWLLAPLWWRWRGL